MAIEVESLFVGKSEVAKILGCSVRMVDVLRSNHGLPCLKIGALIRFDPESVKAWAFEQAETRGVKCLKREVK